MPRKTNRAIFGTELSLVTEVRFSSYIMPVLTLSETGGQRFSPKFTIKTVKHPPKLIVWGCILAAGPGAFEVFQQCETITSERYFKVLGVKMLKRQMDFLDTTLIQQDSAPAHKARIVTDLFKNEEIELLPWPSNSPYLNVIENCCNLMKQKCQHIVPARYQR